MLFSSRVRVRVRIRFIVWLVSCYAHVFALVTIVIVTPSFSKTRIMGTLASQAEMGVWVLAPADLPSPPTRTCWASVWGSPPSRCWGPGVSPPRKIFESVHAKSCNIVHFGRKMVCNAVYTTFLNTLTMGTTFPRVPLEMTPAFRPLCPPVYSACRAGTETEKQE